MQLTPSSQPTVPTVELLYFAGCPCYKDALAALQDALRLAEMSSATVRMVCLQSDEEARGLGFYGSPTIRINGEDVVPHLPGALPCLLSRLPHPRRTHAESTDI